MVGFLLQAGFYWGVAFLIALDTLLPHLHVGSDEPEGLRAGWKRTTLMVSAVTLHNIPEGMSVGLLFAMASQASGAAGRYVSRYGVCAGARYRLAELSRGAQRCRCRFAAKGSAAGRRSWWEASRVSWSPSSAWRVVLAAGWISPYMPWMLAFAAGAMIYVVVEELIPEAHLGEHSNVGTLGVIAGFVIMMVLDVALG